ncbi:MAG: hypothetical protein H7Y39_06380 [Nitrospiraceae bacterium]|nr:hypothetical protein [Nitrospiraceae bacterium]
MPPSSEKFLHDALITPDLPAVEATLDRNGLLLQDTYLMGSPCRRVTLSLTLTRLNKKRIEVTDDVKGDREERWQLKFYPEARPNQTSISTQKAGSMSPQP